MVLFLVIAAITINLWIFFFCLYLMSRYRQQTVTKVFNVILKCNVHLGKSEVLTLPPLTFSL